MFNFQVISLWVLKNWGGGGGCPLSFRSKENILTEINIAPFHHYFRLQISKIVSITLLTYYPWQILSTLFDFHTCFSTLL